MPELPKVDPRIRALVKVLGDDYDLSEFFLKWVECGKNATEAYKQLHPDVTRESVSRVGLAVREGICIPE